MNTLGLLFGSLAASISGNAQTLKPVEAGDVPTCLSEVSDFLAKPLYDSNGDPSYGLYEGGGEYFIVDEEHDYLMETLDENPYEGENGVPIYNPAVSDLKYLMGDENGVRSLTYPDLLFTSGGLSGDFKSHSEEISGEEIADDVTLIPNYQYFTKLGSRHAKNGGKTCSMVASSILLMYYDTFVSDDFVQEEYEHIPCEDVTPTSWKNWSVSPAPGNEGKNGTKEDPRHHEYLGALCTRYYNPFLYDTGATSGQTKGTLEHSLATTKIKDFTWNYVAGNWYDGPNLRAVDSIKKAIDEGRPAIAGGYRHFVVVFGYDDTHVYCHTGWGDIRKVEWCTFTDWQLDYIPSVIDLIPNLEHSHSNNYFSTKTNMFYCSCGYPMVGRNLAISNLTFSPPASGVGSVTSPAVDFEYKSIYKANSQSFFLQSDYDDSYITFYGKNGGSIHGIYFEISASYLGSKAPKYSVDWCDEDGLWHSEYDLNTYTNIEDGAVLGKAIAAKDAVKVRIKAEASQYEGSRLSVKKLVLAIC